MKQFYWLIVGISLLSLASCKGKVKMARDCQTVKIDTVISADEQTYLQYPGKVKAAQDISLAFRVSGTIQKTICGERCTRKSGTTARELDPTDYQVQLMPREAEYKRD